jgi:hypothetical protein
MSTTHIRRGRHKQVARNLALAVATAALAGTGAAMAADGGTAPPNTKTADGGAAPTTKAAPGGAGAGKAAPNTRDRPPLTGNEPVVTDARTGLGRLVADGTIEQAEADVVLRGVIAGSVDPGALVRAGDVSAAHMAAINDVLVEVKRANAPGG